MVVVHSAVKISRQNTHHYSLISVTLDSNCLQISTNKMSVDQMSSSGFVGSSEASDDFNQMMVSSSNKLNPHLARDSSPLNTTFSTTNLAPAMSPKADGAFSASTKEERSATLDEMVKAYETIISHVGEDVNRQGLLKTPQRAAKAMLFFTKGYEENFDGSLDLKVIINYQIQNLRLPPLSSPTKHRISHCSNFFLLLAIEIKIKKELIKALILLEDATLLPFEHMTKVEV